MKRTEYYISAGRIVPTLDVARGESLSERMFLGKTKAVKVVVESGTTIKWHAAFADWSSLFFVKEHIFDLEGPYTLSYYLSGWFVEKYENVVDASNRIDQLIAKSDVHLSSRVYMRSFNPEGHELPEVLSQTLKTGQAPPEILRRLFLRLCHGSSQGRAYWKGVCNRQALGLVPCDHALHLRHELRYRDFPFLCGGASDGAAAL